MTPFLPVLIFNGQLAISPWQTKAAPNMFRNYLFNGYRRLAGEFVFWAVPFGIGVYLTVLM